MKHIHHIIPKHMGGSADPENLVELSIEQHAEAHKILWEKYGKIEDKIAWECLSGRKMTEEERILLANSGFNKFLLNPSKKEKWINKIRESRKKQIITNSHKQKISDSLKLAWENGKFQNRHIDENLRELMKENYIKNNMSQKLSDARKKSDKWKNAMSTESSKIAKRKNSPKSKKISVNGIIYDSIREASKKSFYSYSQLRKILNSPDINDNIFYC